jgi:peroxiredoxin
MGYTHRVRALLLAGLLGACGTPTSSSAESPASSSDRLSVVPDARVPASELAMIGQAAPAWDGATWLGDDTSLADLRGKVVFVRFFTDTCPFCRASAPALRELDEAYRDRGVVVVGMYHPKPKSRPVGREAVAAFAEAQGWRFPVALDTDRSILDAYWPPEHRDYTSVSFLIDQEGVIRFIHPGPEFHPDGPSGHDRCRSDHAAIRAAIDGLIEKA